MKEKKFGKDIILVALPVVGMFYAMFRMLFKISKHFDARYDFFGVRFWKFWFSCIFVELASIIACSPIFLAFYFIMKLENYILTVCFSLLAFIALGFCVYFLTNLVIKKTTPANPEQSMHLE